jgi:hypothetical protein
MNSDVAIEFFAWKDDDPLEIQLEPECLVFKVLPDNALKFVAVNCDAEFLWTLRINHKNSGIQLFPESKGDYDIMIYENDSLLEDWFKFMR